ncbi:MAG: hypothetical protein COY81_02695 [Candidatus Pacebacteria bacterium CG_4_10_14_0_8_um_filter_43_12]|nr:MAG: hypothetical protein COY81_02695 [Candidatus Pacebacteria bacterium CG_4_10_14_0_8_um_filter_43_12]
MRKFYWYFTAYARKHGILVISSLLIGIAFFWFFVPTLVDNLEISKRHFIGIIGEYNADNFDLPDLIKNQLSIGLTRINENGSVSSALAERWTVEHDGATYRFLLKKDLRWQDGESLDPNDIHYNFKEVETIITPSDIVFKLPEPFAPFPVTVAEPIFKHTQQKYLFFFSRPTLIGIGDYQISDYKQKGSRLSEVTIDGRGERYIYRFYLTEDDAITAFKRGEINIIPDLAKKHDVFDWPTTSYQKALKYDAYLGVFFNTRDPNITKNVRQALSYALEKKTGDERAVGPISPLSWAYLPGGKTYQKDWERGTERLLAELPQQPLNFELTTTTLFEDQVENIKEQWEAFGQSAAAVCQTSSAITDKTRCENLKIQVSIKVTNFPDINNFQMLLFGRNIPPDPDQYALWHSDQSSNFTGYKNTRIDNLLEKGRQTNSQIERTAIYQEFQQFFLEDPPAIFLEYLTRYQLNRKSVPDVNLDFRPAPVEPTN